MKRQFARKEAQLMIRVLIVEDEKPISNLIRMSLTKEGFQCTCVHDGAAAADLLEQNAYDLILLDVMLPEVDGFELMEYIRPMEIPVIFLTAKGSVHDRVKGLRLGAEDYIVKPFDTIELLARIDVVLRRYRKCDMVIETGGLRIDTASMRVWRGAEEISLTKTEYDLLLLFARNPRRAMYRETIYERVWGGEYPFGSKAVDLHVQRLRKKVGWETMLQAVNKVGYRLEVTP
jgi:DNA-binding response OmpR family regulator